MAEELQSNEWEFLVGLTSEAIGWKAQPALKAVKAAIREIKKVAKKQGAVAGEGAALLLERLCDALSNVDASDPRFSTGLATALETVMPVIADAPVDREIRRAWLERIFVAYDADEMGCMESVGPHWGALCKEKTIASEWADRFIEECKLVWAPGRGKGYFFKSMPNCLSCLLVAKREQELLEVLALAPRKAWSTHQYGVRALVALGRIPDAMQYAKEAGEHENPVRVAKLCEQLLWEEGQVELAYSEYGLVANETNTYQAWYRAVAKKYKEKSSEQVLADLVALTPGHEGKWFAAAKSAELYDQAITLAKQSPSSPETLIRASRDFAKSRPGFAREAALTALEWLSKGYGYDKTEALVHDAYEHLMEAAASLGTVIETKHTLQRWMDDGTLEDRFVNSVLQSKLDSVD